MSVICKLEDLREKYVVSIKSGCCFGRVDDIIIDTCSAQVQSLVIFGRKKCFGLFGCEEDIIIDWKHIEVLGDDTILVCLEHHHFDRKNKQKKKRLWELFK